MSRALEHAMVLQNHSCFILFLGFETSRSFLRSRTSVSTTVLPTVGTERLEIPPSFSPRNDLLPRSDARAIVTARRRHASPIPSYPVSRARDGTLTSHHLNRRSHSPSEQCYLHGVIYDHGETVMPKQCVECNCYDGSFTCQKSEARCPQLTCPPGEQLSVAEECCKYCPGRSSRTERADEFRSFAISITFPRNFARIKIFLFINYATHTHVVNLLHHTSRNSTVEYLPRRGMLQR